MKKVVAAIAVISALVLVGSGAWPFPDSGTTYSGTPESITIGGFPYEASALVYIAEDQGIFSENGLNVTLRDYNSSLSALYGLMNDETDFSLSSDYNIVGEVYKKRNVSVIGVIDKFQTAYIVGRKDKGIVIFSDLKGKRIGVSRGGIGEFYLGRFLNLHGMSTSDVTLVDLLPSQFVQAITNGSIDALVTGGYIDQIQKRLRNKVVLWPAQSNQDGYWVISCRGGWAASHPEQINRLLKSLAQAEEFIINHPAQAKAIVQKRLNYSDAYMTTAWQDNRYSLSLDQSLLIAMNDEGRWMIQNNLTGEKMLPYFRDYIYTKGLEGVYPDAVNIK
jgi:ABC-type nitrate/sulfonate/bicarbonate transport system substrate-binding protein